MEEASSTAVPHRGCPGAQRSERAIGTQRWKGQSSKIRSITHSKAWQDNKGGLSSSAVKPDPPKNLQVKPLRNSQVEVSWEYPDSWSTPHSYFSLKFFVQLHRKRERVRWGGAQAWCIQVRFMQPMWGQCEDPNNQAGARCRVRPLLRTLSVYHTQPTQRPRGASSQRSVKFREAMTCPSSPS